MGRSGFHQQLPINYFFIFKLLSRTVEDERTTVTNQAQEGGVSAGGHIIIAKHPGLHLPNLSLSLSLLISSQAMPSTPTERPRPPPLRMPETREVMTSEVHKMLDERRQGTFTRLSQDQYEDMDLTIHEDQQVFSPTEFAQAFNRPFQTRFLLLPNPSPL